MPITPIPDLPAYTGEAPNRQTQEQAEFSANSDDSLQYQTSLSTNLNAVTAAISIVAGEAEVFAGDALNSESNSAQSAANSQNSANNAAASANFKGNWSGATGAASTSETYFHDGKRWQPLVNLPNIAASEPSLTNNDWSAVTIADNYYNNPLALLDPVQDSTGSVEGHWKFGSLSGSAKWRGGVLAPNGKIYCVPFNSAQVLEIDPTTNTTTLFGSLSGSAKWIGGVLAPNGKIYCVPYNSAQVLEIDPTTNTTTLFGSLSGSGRWYCGVLAPNGKIYCVPFNNAQVLEIDPTTNTTTLFGSLSGIAKWRGGVLAPNGKIYCVPNDSTQVLEISAGMNGKNWWALSAYVNKF